MSLDFLVTNTGQGAARACGGQGKLPDWGWSGSFYWTGGNGVRIRLINARIGPLNRSSRRESALAFPVNLMERTHVRCYEVRGKRKGRSAAASRGVGQCKLSSLRFSASRR